MASHVSKWEQKFVSSLTWADHTTVGIMPRCIPITNIITTMTVQLIVNLEISFSSALSSKWHMEIFSCCHTKHATNKTATNLDSHNELAHACLQLFVRCSWSQMTAKTICAALSRIAHKNTPICRVKMCCNHSCAWFSQLHSLSLFWSDSGPKGASIGLRTRFWLRRHVLFLPYQPGMNFWSMHFWKQDSQGRSVSSKSDKMYRSALKASLTILLISSSLPVKASTICTVSSISNLESSVFTDATYLCLWSPKHSWEMLIPLHKLQHTVWGHANWGFSVLPQYL